MRSLFPKNVLASIMLIAPMLGRWLDNGPPRARWLVLIVVVISLPCLRIPLVADDIWHRAMLLGDRGWLPSIPAGRLSLFSFISGSPEDGQHAIERGFGPWWMLPTLRLAFFRPLSSATHALDYMLWPSSPALMHAQSIAWYVAAVLLASKLYKRLLGDISPRAAGIATIFYAIDPTHAIPVAWIANRNSVIATTFGLATLLLFTSRRNPFVVALLLGLALCSGESAIATVVYLASYAAFLDERPLATKLRELAPSAVVVLALAINYRIGRHGVIGSGIYSDPIHAPAAFAKNFLTNFPLLASAELGAPQPDMHTFLPDTGKAIVVAIACAVLVWSAVVFRSLLRSEDDRIKRVTRFFLASSTIAIIPSVATFPSARLLVFAGFGFVGALSLVCIDQQRHRVFRTWTWIGHLVLAPLFFFIGIQQFVAVDGIIRRLSNGVPSDGSAKHKRLVLVNAMDTAFAHYLLIVPQERGESPPTRMVLFAGNQRAVHLTRKSEHTFVVRSDEGFYRSGTEIIFRDPHIPLAVGTKIVLGDDVTVTVTHATSDGTPDEAEFDLSKDLDESYLFRQWTDEGIVPLSLPKIGQTVHFPARFARLADLH